MGRTREALTSPPCNRPRKENRHGTYKSYGPKDPPSTKTNRCIHSKLSTSTPQSLHSHTVQNIGARERSRTPHRIPVEGSNAAKEQIVRHLRLRNLWVNHVIPVNASSQIISVRFHGRSFKDAPSLLNHLPSWCCCPNHLP